MKWKVNIQYGSIFRGFTFSIFSSPLSLIVTCPPLTLMNGSMISTESSPGSLASFSCDPCYELQGPKNTTCASNGTWLYPIPSCTPIGEKSSNIGPVGKGAIGAITPLSPLF